MFAWLFYVMEMQYVSKNPVTHKADFIKKTKQFLFSLLRWSWLLGPYLNCLSMAYRMSTCLCVKAVIRFVFIFRMVRNEYAIFLIFLLKLAVSCDNFPLMYPFESKLFFY